MGGDDLGSDEENYLNITDLPSTTGGDDDVILEEDDKESDAAAKNESVGSSSKTKKKRKRSSASSLTSFDPSTLNTPKGRRVFLSEAGRDIVHRDADVQAAFLRTCCRHFAPTSGDDEDDDALFRPENLWRRATTSTSTSSSSEEQQRLLLPSFDEVVRAAVPSLKRLRKWRVPGSPMVVVACVSARRATAVLKELSPLRVRVAKLFAKHLKLDEQAAALRDAPCGIAVGTPNRLLRLIADGALSFGDTSLFLVDARYEDDKGYTVCTHNDVAPDLAALVRTAVGPRLPTSSKTGARKNALRMGLV